MPQEQKGLDFGPGDARPSRRRTFTVAQLTDRIQGALQTEFFDVWVEGEISNLRALPSGIVYFSLKDANAQISCVVFKQAARLLKFKPREGAKVLARGSVSVYPPKGTYALSVEVLEPLGKGALQQAFEDLKQKLEKEGLFDRSRKRPLPALPRRIGIVTSPGGAVIQDILRVLERRFRNLDVLVYPARVQGPEAAGEVAQGIRVLNGTAVDVILVARGGGSLEDLWPFNEEIVARALAASRIPTISAVGHETDVTISDFVADHRAPTPSAAAELVVKARAELEDALVHLERRAASALRLRAGRARQRLAAVGPARLAGALERRLQLAQQRTQAIDARLQRASPDRRLQQQRLDVERAVERLTQAAARAVDNRRQRLAREAARLDGLSPLAVLSRGYAVAFDAQDRILRRAADTSTGDVIRVRLHEGTVEATVKGTTT